MGQRFSPAVEDVLADLLPDYQATRRRYPLWTYERRSWMDGGRSWTWEGTNSWPDRLRWSAQLPTFALLGELEEWLRTGDLNLWAFSPDTRNVTARRNEELVVVPLPDYFRCRVASIFAATDHPEPPAEPDEIQIPTVWRALAWLDETDAQQLGDSVRGALLRRRRTEDGEEPLLASFQHFAVDAGGSSGPRREDIEGGKKQLAIELCERAGLLPDRTSGRRNVLPPEALPVLQEEGEGIVGEVRDWEPTAALESRLRDLLGSPSTALSLLEEERAKRGHGPAGSATSQSRVLKAGRRLRFPWLTPAEIGCAREKGRAGAVARELVRGRMTADISPKRYRNVLSATRPGDDVTEEEEGGAAADVESVPARGTENS